MSFRHNNHNERTLQLSPFLFCTGEYISRPPMTHPMDLANTNSTYSVTVHYAQRPNAVRSCRPDLVEHHFSKVACGGGRGLEKANRHASYRLSNLRTATTKIITPFRGSFGQLKTRHLRLEIRAIRRSGPVEVKGGHRHKTSVPTTLALNAL